MKKLFIYILLFAFIITGCSSNKTISDSDSTTSPAASSIEAVDEKVEFEILESDELKALKVDESQEVMVLMYHNIGEEEATWTRTPENFRRDLETLYNNGFRAISLEDYALGNIATEKGHTPVVITFDDGNENNFRYLENGEIDPTCAIGILESFKADFPDFNTTATFFLNQLAFGSKSQEVDKLKFLAQNGYSIGNHTLTHLDLKKASPEDIQKEIASLKSTHESTYPELNIQTLALPYGAKPSEENYSLTYKGLFDNISYDNIAVLLVGWDPYFSPYHKDFDFSKIRRVRASETNVDGVGLYDWLKAYDQGTKFRYISDGNPATISIPESKQELIQSSKFQDKKIITY